MRSSLASFRALQQSGLGVLDIGARGGAHPALAEIAPLVEFVGFEPDPDEAARLNAAAPAGGFRSVRFIPSALGEHSATARLHLCRSGGASSLYEPNSAFLARFPDARRFEVVSTVDTPVRPLDSLRGDLPPYVGFIKADTQGAEVSILRGGVGTLREAVAVEVEVEFAALYRGQPLFRDVDAFMAEQGFSLFKLRRMHWVRRTGGSRPARTAGQIVFGDALYLRDPLDGGASARLEDPRQAEALILLAALYDAHDFALELTADPAIASLVDADGVGAFVRRRSQPSRLKSLWRRRADRLKLQSWWHGYERIWARGDTDFYTRF
jgi:FkbM family methyltransferase